MKKTFILLFCLLTIWGVSAQNKEKSYWSVTLEGGLNKIDGDIKQEFNDIIPNSTAKISFGGSVEYTLTPVWSMGVEYYYLPLKAHYNNPDNGAFVYNLDTKMHNVDYFMAFNLLKGFYKNSNSKWGLWATIGAGMAFYHVDYETVNNGAMVKPSTNNGFYGYDNNMNLKGARALTVPIGALIEYNFNKNLALGTKIQYRSYNKDNLDGREFWGVTNDFVSLGTLQLRWKFGARDKNHTRNMNLTEFNGDPTAEDLNNLAKKVNGLKDDLDITNKDVEELKNRPQLPANLEQRVKKLEDILCPDGPDTDNDGVPDCRDKEPNTPLNTPVDFWGRTLGCYDNSAAIYFDFDKTDLDEQANKAIEIAANKLKADPSLTVEVRGFCDNLGSPAYNEKLSQRRAEKVKAELVNYGIDAKRIIANGKGKILEPQTAYRPNRRCNFFYDK